MKYIIINFIGWMFAIFGYFTAIAIIGIPVLIFGMNLIKYSERNLKWADNG